MSVWDHAVKRKNAKTKELEGQCNRCNKVIKCSGNSTTTLKSHLKTHGINFDREQQQEPTSSKNVVSEKPTPKPTLTMDAFLKKMTLKEIVTDMATDNITIRAITRNKYIRQSVSRDGFNLPKNETGVMKLIHDDFDEKKLLMVRNNKELLKKGAKFSLSVDEYTSSRNRRYFGINLHENINRKTIKTGLVRILGSCSALDMIEIVKNHVKDFGLSFDHDIVGSTLDGASVNKKFIRHVKSIGQLCLNHGIHLGVCDTLYPKKAREEPEFDDSLLGLLDSDEVAEDDDFDDIADVDFIEDTDAEEEIDYNEILKNARKLIKFIKTSSVKNQVFQDKVFAELGHHKELHLDVKTRWNSIPTMLDSLIQTEKPLRETLLEFEAE